MLAKRVPIQLGGMTDPFSALEQKIGVGLQLLHVLADHDYPTLISTKSTHILSSPYIDVLKRGNFYVRVSFTGAPRWLARKLEVQVPEQDERLMLIEGLADVGIPTSGRVQPLLIGAEDEAAALIQRLGDHGARHVSAEYLKWPIESSGHQSLEDDLRETLERICQLQPEYSAANTPAMQERGRLVRGDLKADIEKLRPRLSVALGAFGNDLFIDASDGIGRKTELPWVRVCSRGMSPNPTEGFYCVMHFSTDGSAVHVTVGCGSSRFHKGSSVPLPDDELDRQTAWARHVVIEEFGTLEPFGDPADFGARRPLPISFQRATAISHRVAYADIRTADFGRLLEQNGAYSSSGGNVEWLLGWDIDEWLHEPTAFRLTRRAAALQLGATRP